jgi:predicted dehydrogenase
VEFQNGAVANLTASRVSTERVRKFRYFQPNEYFSIDFTRRDATLIRVDRSGPTPQIAFQKLTATPQEPLRAELAAFIESVRTRNRPLVGGTEGKQALALAEKVMNCIEQHATLVNVPLGRSVGQSGES